MHLTFIGFCLPFIGNDLNTLMYRGNQSGIQSSNWEIASDIDMYRQIKNWTYVYLTLEKLLTILRSQDLCLSKFIRNFKSKNKICKCKPSRKENIKLGQLTVFNLFIIILI